MARKTRRATGRRAFGFNYFTLPPGAEGREHHHVDSNMRRSTSSSAAEDDADQRRRADLKPGRFVRVDPGSTRVPVAGDDGLEFVTFGAPPDGGYEPPEWG